MFATLQDLKARVLPVSLQDSSDYDVALQQFGRGVATLFERRCNRLFGRMAGDTYEVAGDSEVISLPRYPVETIDALSLVSEYGATPEPLLLSDSIGTLNLASGLLFLRGAQGGFYSRLTVTYTGGYWYDAQGGQTLPAGATPLEPDVLDAWYLQCAHLWASLDHTGDAMRPAEAGIQSAAAKLSAATLIPAVEAILSNYRRLS